MTNKISEFYKMYWVYLFRGIGILLLMFLLTSFVKGYFYPKTIINFFLVYLALCCSLVLIYYDFYYILKNKGRNKNDKQDD